MDGGNRKMKDTSRLTTKITKKKSREVLKGGGQRTTENLTEIKPKEISANKIFTETITKKNILQDKKDNDKEIVEKVINNTKLNNIKKVSKFDKLQEEKKDVKTVRKEKVTTRKLKKIDKSEITNYNIYLFHQGNNYEAYNIMGAHIRTENRKKGVQFVTWAPKAKEVYIVGDFNDFKIDEKYKMQRVSENGIWKAFFYDVKEGDKYKYCIINKNGEKETFKSDPYSIMNELRPHTASIVYQSKSFRWGDKKWINQRNKVNALENALNIYEVHLGSWKRNKDGGFLTYEELSEELTKYLQEMNYTHVELMPIMEHPLDESWGYQAINFYAPTSRYGDLEGLKKLINKLHQANIGVIMDWAPGHFCKDAHGLYKFSGDATYEYEEEWKADNKDWGTFSFDLGRPEVKSYLISNALYWFREFHIDGLRVDAVSSILYLDYSKNEGEWIPNKFGGNGNLEAIQFLKDLNKAVFAEFPTVLMIAEESTSWPNVTKPTIHDGLGFNFKWNMGWMNDTLEYIELDPKYRRYHHKNVTFAMMYNYAENYILPLSHDEVVHGKKSLIGKMWGDKWNKFAGLRCFVAYMMGHPGKKLTFMGCEFAQDIEWREYEELKWNLIKENELNKKTLLFFKDVNKLYLDNKALWELDHQQEGFEWIEADNNEQSVLIFSRKSRRKEETLIFVVNFKSEVYYDYQIGVPFLGEYEESFNTDNTIYGGSGQVMESTLKAEKQPFHNQPYSIKIKVPPMATLILKINSIVENQEKNQKELVDD